MLEKNKKIEEQLQDIKYLLAGILLGRNPNVKEVARIIGCSDKTLTKIYPDKKRKSKNDK